MDVTTEPTILMKLQFFIRFHTTFGESLWLGGSTEELGSDDPALAIPMEYLNEQFWQVTIEIDRKKLQKDGICYKYYFKNKDGELIGEWGRDRKIDDTRKNTSEIHLYDTWNHAGEFDNAFFTAPFKNVLLKQNHPTRKGKKSKYHTHIFKVKAPLVKKHEVVCLVGGSDSLTHWNTEEPVLLCKDDDWWSVQLDLSADVSPIPYKYGIYNTKEKKL